jgi:competence protein ComFC
MALAMTNRLEVWANAALSFLYPEVCQLCGKQPATPARSFICEACRTGVRFIAPPFCPVCGRPFVGEVATELPCSNCRGLDLGFHWARSAAVARGCVLEAIHRYKYRGQLWYEGFLAELLGQQAGPELRRPDWDCCVPVPLHPVKERERGFNQAHRLACRLSMLTGIPVEATILRRVLPTPSQTRLSRNARIQNMRRAFALRRNRAVKGWRCLVIDDVFTTGSTTGACARVLREAGADLVAVWTVARASEDPLPGHLAAAGKA